MKTIEELQKEWLKTNKVTKIKFVPKKDSPATNPIPIPTNKAEKDKTNLYIQVIDESTRDYGG
jgi:hypothetical protein